MNKIKSIWVLSLLLLPAVLLRTLFITHGASYHPDERFIIMTVEGLNFSKLDPHSFAYGSFPFYCLWVLRNIASLFSQWLASYDGLFILGRCLSALFGIIGIVLTYLIAKDVFKNKLTALVSAALLSFNLFHIQLSRFFAVDVMLSTFCLAALFLFLKIRKDSSWKLVIVTGLFLGLAMATKITALALLLPFFCALFWPESKPTRKDISELLKLGFASLLVLQALFALINPSPFSQVSTLVLTLITLMLLTFQGGPSPGLRVMVSTVLVGLIVFLLVEPFAAINYSQFLHDSKEQLDMVKGIGRPPYTIQYAGTAPYFYHLKQMLFYTMGIPTALAVFAGTLFVLLSQLKKSNIKELILLAWVVPLFLVVGAYQVKFPRYLIPIYPLLFIFAAHLLVSLYEAGKVRMAQPVRKFIYAFPLCIVLVWTVVHGSSLLRIYTIDHTYNIASRWVFDNISSGATILGPHWDDRLPATLPGFEASRYRMEGNSYDLGFYDAPDFLPKLRKISSQFASADAIVFATPRIQDSLPRIPEEQKTTITLLKLLYTGDIGYQLVKTVKEYPGIGSFSFNDDLADESLSVYDHPKASIFVNKAHLSATEIEEKVQSNILKPHLPSMEQMLLKNAPDENIGEPQMSIAWSVITWYGVVLLIGILTLPLLASLLPDEPALALGLSRGFGLIVFILLIWFLSYLGKVSLTQEVLATLLASLGAVFFTYLCIRGKDNPLFQPMFLKEFLRVEILFLAGFAIVLIFRAFNPEVYWGEKPMDFTFYNYFARLTNLPPDDPWAAGHPLYYYYLGSFLFGTLQKLCGGGHGVGFNISIAIIGALHIVGLYAVLKSLTKSWALGIFGALCIVFISNLDIIKLVVSNQMKLNFDLFWASSRTLHTPGINEYPLWSLLFSDLHAHLICLPFTALALGFGLAIIKSSDSPFSLRSLALKVSLGLCLGFFFSTNSWDFVNYGFISGILFVFYWLKSAFSNRIRLLHRGSDEVVSWLLGILSLIPQVIVDVALTASAVVIGASPLILEASKSISPHYGFVTGEEFNNGMQIFRALGHWSPIIIGMLIILAGQALTRTSALKNLFVCPVSFILGCIPLLFGLWSISTTKVNIPFSDIHWGILCVLGLGIFLGTVSALNSERIAIEIPKRKPSWLNEEDSEETDLIYSPDFASDSVPIHFISLLLVAACILISASELFFLMDRANTLFKTYHAIWTLLGISCIVGIWVLTKNLKDPDNGIITVPIAITSLVIGMIVFAICFVGSGINIVSFLPSKHINGPRPTLDGTAYLANFDGDEYKLIEWINTRISGTPIIVEAIGNSYGPFTRISMHTGLPVLLGWDYHVSQRGSGPELIESRKNAIHWIYGGSNAATANRVLKLHGVSYVVVGNLERRTDYFMPAGLQKFENSPAQFTKVFQSGQVALFSVN